MARRARLVVLSVIALFAITVTAVLATTSTASSTSKAKQARVAIDDSHTQVDYQLGVALRELEIHDYLTKMAEFEKAEKARIAAEKAERARQARIAEAERQALARASRSRAATAAPPAEVGNGCGGSLPPCWVMKKESGGDIRIWNGGCYAPVGWTGRSPCGTSSASGKWQIVRGTWGGYGGYLNAADAPESLQDEKARALWAGGRGCSHWNAC